MFSQWLIYFWNLLVTFFYAVPPIKGKLDKVEGPSLSSIVSNTEADPSKSVIMSNMQLEKKDQSTALVSANREEEIETVEETTLSESQKDLGHTQISEKAAEFDSTVKKSIQEDHKSHKSESNKNVKQSESVEISENKQVMKSSWETSQSYSMEETEEYEIEG